MTHQRIGARAARAALTLPVVLLAVLVMAFPAASQQPRDPKDVIKQIQALAWVHGPADANIGGLGTIKVPKGLSFLDGPNTRKFLELNLNPPRDNHYTLSSQDFSWFAVFYFESSGYVKDDEKLNPDALLKSLQDSDARANDERKRLSMPAIYTMGWHVPPHYDSETKRLEWGVQLRQSDVGNLVVNYTIRILGRRGVMHATLVSDPQDLDKDIIAFKSALGGYGFIPGERYAEFKAGDRVAEYGLAALVLGGAAAVATKTGFGKALIKFIGIGVVALFGVITAFFRKLRRS
ncbi:MAG: DUF2167 domain-containing protein [Candidatus Rokuibacteriota bacterium]|nr:MAG: DUF2167 domain-containing protein [Candidatus Rokubacteria bacterium]